MSSLREGVLLRGGGTAKATPYREAGPVQHPSPRESPEQPQAQVEERRTTIRRAADLPVVGGGSSTFRLGDVYAEELERLRQHAHAQGFAAGHAEGMEAAAAVVAETERAAENLNEEIELLGPVRTRTVEEAQAKVVSIIRSLEESGVLTLTRGQDDEFVA